MNNERKMIIQLAHRMILVDGYLVARSYKEFESWIRKNNYKRKDFHNWPFISTIE